MQNDRHLRFAFAFQRLMANLEYTFKGDIGLIAFIIDEHNPLIYVQLL